ncbi:MAG TPA: glycosyltransferase, partial [Tahibacter sp.]|nr:glycosyltransferase [Tahibacter sp.]
MDGPRAGPVRRRARPARRRLQPGVLESRPAPRAAHGTRPDRQCPAAGLRAFQRCRRGRSATFLAPSGPLSRGRSRRAAAAVRGISAAPARQRPRAAPAQAVRVRRLRRRRAADAAAARGVPPVFRQGLRFGFGAALADAPRTLRPALRRARAAHRRAGHAADVCGLASAARSARGLRSRRTRRTRRFHPLVSALGRARTRHSVAAHRAGRCCVPPRRHRSGTVGPARPHARGRHLAAAQCREPGADRLELPPALGPRAVPAHTGALAPSPAPAPGARSLLAGRSVAGGAAGRGIRAERARRHQPDRLCARRVRRGRGIAQLRRRAAAGRHSVRRAQRRDRRGEPAAGPPPRCVLRRAHAPGRQPVLHQCRPDAGDTRASRRGRVRRALQHRLLVLGARTVSAALVGSVRARRRDLGAVGFRARGRGGLHRQARARDSAGDDRILLRDGFLDRDGMWSLQAACDVYLSLHRAEGFGLGLAECMALGKPVIATAYSGNLQFMDADNSCLVPYRLVPVNEGEYPDWRDQHWAEPDVAAAAAHLRRLA